MSISQAGLGAAVNPRLPATITAASAVPSPSNATATVTVINTGLLFATGGSPPNWIDPPIGMANFEAQMVPVSGTLSAGNVNTWESLGTSRSYTRDRTSIGINTFIGTLEIRRIGGTAVLTSSSVTIEAQVETP